MSDSDNNLLFPRDKRVFTTREAAQYLGISYSYLRTIRMTGQIKDWVPPPPHILVGGAIRYDRKDLDRWLDEAPRYGAGNRPCEVVQ